MTIAITPELQQPVPGVYSALIDLTTHDVARRRARTPSSRRIGCKSKKHTIGVTRRLRAEPEPAGAAVRASTVDAKCS